MRYSRDLNMRRFAARRRLFLTSLLLPLWLHSVLADTSAQTPVEVVVDLDQPMGNLTPIWRFFGADEPNYATTAEGKRLLRELGGLRPNEVYFRAHNLMTTGNGEPELKWGSTNLYTESNEKPVYDWTRVDQIIDSYLARGLHPYLEIGFMPEALSSAPSAVTYHRQWRQEGDNDGKESGWTYPPRDFERWAELVYQWTVHNVARYGSTEVERWYFEVWNEPDLSFYWSGTADDFFRLHDTAVDAIRRALPKARVGGADVADARSPLMEQFLEHVSTGRNYATGKTGTPTDFLSFHAKGQPSYVDGHVRMDIARQLNVIGHAFTVIASHGAVAGLPVIIGENDPEGCAACSGPQNDYRNGVMYSSYTAALYPRIWELAREQHIQLEGALSWSFTFVGKPWFAGYRQLATHGVDLPVMNVFRLFAKLGATQLAASSDRQRTLKEVMEGGVRGTTDVGVIAARDDSRQRVDTLVWNYNDDDVAGPTERIRLHFAGRPVSDTVLIWRVDSAHGDAFSAWNSMGMPMNPSRRQRSLLKMASRMYPERLRMRGDSVDFTLPSHGVALLETSVAHQGSSPGEHALQ